MREQIHIWSKDHILETDKNHTELKPLKSNWEKYVKAQ